MTDRFMIRIVWRLIIGLKLMRRVLIKGLLELKSELMRASSLWQSLECDGMLGKEGLKMIGSIGVTN